MEYYFQALKEIDIKYVVPKELNRHHYHSHAYLPYLWLYVFSSPEHEVLMVSYWDSALSGVRRPSCVVRCPSSTFYLVYALEATVLVGYS